MNKTLQFESKITKFENINPLFSRVKIRIAYTGLNRNQSYISKDTFEKCIETIYNCPIIGEFNESLDDFRGHGGKVEISDEGIKWINTTIPYGVIDANSEITWEEVTEEDGTVNNYLCATGYLWTGRYPELEKVIENSKSHSMEIDINSGKFSEIDNQKVYEITDFVFSGFCILGDDVEPCFESSDITAYSLNKENFKKQFNQMVVELKFSLNRDVIKHKTIESKVASIDVIEDSNINNTELDLSTFQQEGGNTVSIEEILAKYNLTIEDLSSKEIDSTQFSLEELEAKVKEVFEIVENPVPKEAPTEFTWSSEQLEDELRRIVSQNKIEDDWGWEYSQYYFVDYLMDDKVVIVYDREDSYYVGFPYSVNNDLVTVDMSEEQRYKADWVKMNLVPETNDLDNNGSTFIPDDVMDYRLKVKEAELNKSFEVEKEKLMADSKSVFEKLQSEFNALKEQYSTLEERANSLESDLAAKVVKEREDAENAIFESFTHELTEEEMEAVKSKSAKMSLEDIETKLFALVGKKKAKLNFSKVEEKPVRVNIPTEVKSVSDKEYADLIEKYSKK